LKIVQSLGLHSERERRTDWYSLTRGRLQIPQNHEQSRRRGMGRPVRRPHPRQQCPRSLRPPGPSDRDGGAEPPGAPHPPAAQGRAPPRRKSRFGGIARYGSPHPTRSWRRSGPRGPRRRPPKAAFDSCGPEHDRVEENRRPRPRGGGILLRNPWGKPFGKRHDPGSGLLPKAESIERFLARRLTARRIIGARYSWPASRDRHRRRPRGEGSP
jgi:hypothetical protein